MFFNLSSSEQLKHWFCIGGGGVDLCGNPVPSGGGTDDFDFSQMIAAGFLNSDGEAATGITYFYDNCSQTVGLFFIGVYASSSMCPQPFVYNPTSHVVISYDDATSFGMSTSTFLSSEKEIGVDD